MGVLSAAARRQRFEELYADSYRPITGYVRRRLGTGGSEADDVISEIFVVAWRRLETIPPPPKDRLWLYGVARHATAQSLRSRQRRGRLFERVANEISTSTQWSSADDDPVHDRVRVVVAGLRRRDREVIELAFWEGLSYAEIAALLGCSENAVALRIRRAKERVAKSLATASPMVPLPPFACIQQPATLKPLAVERSIP